MTTRMSKSDEAYQIGLSKGYDRGQQAAEQAAERRIEGLQETVTELKIQNAALFDLLQKIVNSATGSMGVDSCGYDYAHIRQVVLDLGRDVLKMADREVSDPLPYVDTAAKYGLR